MVDTLSQNEIDALLSALQPSEDAVAATPEPSPGAAVSASANSNPREQNSSYNNERSNISSNIANKRSLSRKKCSDFPRLFR